MFAWRHFLSADTPMVPTDNAVSGMVAHAPTSSQFVLAPSSREFLYASTLSRISRTESARMLGTGEHEVVQTFMLTPHGIHARLPLFDLQRSPQPGADSQTYLALLFVVRGCPESQGRQFLVLLLRPNSSEQGGPPEYLVGTRDFHVQSDGTQPLPTYARGIYLSEGHLAKCSSKWVMGDVYIPHYPSRTMNDLECNADTHDALRLAPSELEVRHCNRLQGLPQECGEPFDVKLPHLQEGFHVIDVSRRRGLGPLAVRLGIPSRHRHEEVHATMRTHEMDHPNHVHLWSFAHGTASKIFDSDVGLGAKGLQVKMTPVSTAKTTSDTLTQGNRTYLLSVEIHDPSEDKRRGGYF